MKNFNIELLLQNKSLTVDKNFFSLDKKNKGINTNKLKFLMSKEKLNFLKNLILQKKRLRILEFGTGISTLVIAKSLSINKSRFSNKKELMKFGYKNFISFTVDNNIKWVNISKKNLNILKLNKLTEVIFSKLKMENFCGFISSSFNILPNFTPDLIFLDGGDQSLITGKVNNINFSDPSFTPIQNDILKIEPFLFPGAIILIDGRGNQAHFLRKKLYRKWSYRYIKLIDTHIFELKDTPIGIYNKKIINFYKSID